jgi:hypothetical protein
VKIPGIRQRIRDLEPPDTRLSISLLKDFQDLLSAVVAQEFEDLP